MNLYSFILNKKNKPKQRFKINYLFLFDLFIEIKIYLIKDIIVNKFTWSYVSVFVATVLSKVMNLYSYCSVRAQSD